MKDLLKCLGTTPLLLLVCCVEPLVAEKYSCQNDTDCPEDWYCHPTKGYCVDQRSVTSGDASSSRHDASPTDNARGDNLDAGQDADTGRPDSAVPTDNNRSDTFAPDAQAYDSHLRDAPILDTPVQDIHAADTSLPDATVVPVWSRYSQEFPHRLNAIHGFDTDNIWAVGNAGLVLYYDGSLWTTMVSPTAENLHAVSGDTEGNYARIWVAGDNGVLYTKDVSMAGNNWAVVDVDTTESIHSLWASDYVWTYAVTDGGTVFRCSTGITCSEDTPTTSPLYGVWGYAQHRCAVGADGAIAYHNGFGWSPVATALSSALRAIWMGEDYKSWAVGDQGVVYYFNGTGWGQLPVNSNGADLRAVWGSSTEDVWIAGGPSGVRVHYSDDIWSAPQLEPGDIHYNGIWGTAPDNIWIVGEDRQAQKGVIEHYALP